MKRMRKYILITIALLLFSLDVKTQDLGEVNNSHTPNCSSLLESNRSNLEVLMKFGEDEFMLDKFFGMPPGKKGTDKRFYIHDQVYNEISSFGKVKSEIFKFFNKIDSENFYLNDALYLITSKIDEDEIVTFIHILDGELHGYIHKVNSKTCNKQNLEKIIKLYEKYSKVRRIIWIGDSISSFDIYKVADDFGVEISRRSRFISKPLKSILSLSADLENLEIRSSNSVIINAVPKNERDLITAKKSTVNQDEWAAFNSEVDNIVDQSLSKLDISIKNIKNEIIHGDKDVVFLVAHSDKLYLYINGNRIGIEDIKNWESIQVERKRPRIAVLLSCNTGEVEQVVDKWIFFRKPRMSFTELLIDKGYFDYVISPDTEIGFQEVRELLSLINSGITYNELRDKSKSWHSFVNNVIFELKNYLYYGE